MCLAGACAGLAFAQPLPPEHPSGWIDKQPVASRHYMVAAANPLATRAGDEILRAGGNAVDAAVAAVLTSFVAEPLLTGLGAGGYLLDGAQRRDSTGQLGFQRRFDPAYREVHRLVHVF